jgi:hypothetical protein
MHLRGRDLDETSHYQVMRPVEKADDPVGDTFGVRPSPGEQRKDVRRLHVRLAKAGDGRDVETPAWRAVGAGDTKPLLQLRVLDGGKHLTRRVLYEEV